jgi:hypothetical protein
VSGYFEPNAPPVTPPVPHAGPIGGGQGVGLSAIGSVPIPSLFADASSQRQQWGGGVGQAAVGVTPIGQGAKHDPFKAALESLRNDRIMRIALRIFGKGKLSDEYLLENLLAAERTVEREMRVFLTPREIIPVGTPFAEVQQLAQEGKPMVEEPGYPYDTGLFQGMDLEVRHRPIINIYRLWYAYQGEGSPGAASVLPLYDIPLDWIQPDRKYGKINLLPTATFTNLPLNSFLLSVLGSGRDIPFGLKLRYSAGLIDAKTDYPDILVLIKRRAIISMMDDSFLPQSGSISADGLSQSLSMDVDKYRESAERMLDKIASSIKGIRMIVLG